jgi:hypothetical protein
MRRREAQAWTRSSTEPVAAGWTTNARTAHAVQMGAELLCTSLQPQLGVWLCWSCGPKAWTAMDHGQHCDDDNPASEPHDVAFDNDAPWMDVDMDAMGCGHGWVMFCSRLAVARRRHAHPSQAHDPSRMTQVQTRASGFGPAVSVAGSRLTGNHAGVTWATAPAQHAAAVVCEGQTCSNGARLSGQSDGVRRGQLEDNEECSVRAAECQHEARSCLCESTVHTPVHKALLESSKHSCPRPPAQPSARGPSLRLQASACVDPPGHVGTTKACRRRHSEEV